jgi:hypothetical protein
MLACDSSVVTAVKGELRKQSSSSRPWRGQPVVPCPANDRTNRTWRYPIGVVDGSLTTAELTDALLSQIALSGMS